MSALLFTLLLALGACSAGIKPLPPAGPAPMPAPTASVPATQEPAPAAEPQAPVPDVAEAPPTVLPSIPPRRRPGEQPTERRGRKSDQGDQPVRVALATSERNARISATGGAWALYDGSGERLIGRLRAGETWTMTSGARGVTVRSDDGSVQTYRGPVIARPQEPNTLLVYNGKRFRGELMVHDTDAALLVVNRLSIESYLRGVVPLEIGVDRTMSEQAAVRAQAVAARSYTYTRLNESRAYDLTATVLDQVYGGVDAERPVSDDAIDATRDQVLMYNGRVINAPYHANSGGCTAAASEVWKSGDQPYLIPVSDRIPGTSRFYCEESPKFRWTRSFDASALRTVLEKYLRTYVSVPSGGVGTVRAIRDGGRTQSGRMASLLIETDRGRYTLRGNDIRFVLRTPGGEILPSTMFDFDVSTDGDGNVSQLTIRGTGAGHGVGMDQWGAIARARAGQDYLTILRTYYPGTTVGYII